MRGDRFGRTMTLAPFICVGLLWLSTPVSAFLIVFGAPLVFLIAFSKAPEVKQRRNRTDGGSGYNLDGRAPLD